MIMDFIACAAHLSSGTSVARPYLATGGRVSTTAVVRDAAAGNLSKGEIV
jgi:hypothetical protein